MKEFHQPDRRHAPGERPQHGLSQRERVYSKRQKRARKHLERMRSEPRPQPQLPFQLVVPAAVIASLAIGVLFGSPLVATARSWIAGEPLRIEAISVRGTEHLSPAEIAESTGLPLGAEWASVDPREIEASLIAHPWIADARAVRLPTGRLLIHIGEHSPRAVVAIGKPAQDFAVNQEGVPFAPAGGRAPAGLPRLIPNAAVEPSELFLSDEGDPTGFAFRLPNLKPRIVLGHDHFDARLTSLARLLETGLEEVEGSETLDLRFADQAVLRGAPSPKGAKQAAATRGHAASSKARPTG
ncbi:MAG: FtsQ-type POTRA domain-containing protein [Deltaproteobacteria bacterium]|nr:FtsQ-type POTRA domain-containing protein [Deltaproteobacteria bacterium]